MDLSRQLSCRLGRDRAYSGRLWVTGDRKGTGDVGESEYGENADMRLRSGDGSIGDFNAIIADEDSARSWKLLSLTAVNYYWRLCGMPLGVGAGDVGAGVMES